jgi:hypothetical protein
MARALGDSNTKLVKGYTAKLAKEAKKVVSHFPGCLADSRRQDSNPEKRERDAAKPRHDVRAPLSGEASRSGFSWFVLSA